MSRQYMDHRNVIYPQIDEERMQPIEPSAETLSQYGTQYFFSPGFKTSDLVIENVLQRYSENKKSFLGKMRDAMGGEKVITISEIKKKRKLNAAVQTILNARNQKNQDTIMMGQVLACFEDNAGTDNIFILTRDRLISDYRDNEGYAVEFLLKNITLTKNGVYSLDGIRYVKGAAFSAGFINLFREIRSLGEDVELTNFRHPLRKEPLEIRGKYIGILIDKCFFDGYLSANEVIRLEILARQLNVSSQAVIQQMNKTIEARKKDNYLSLVVKKINDIPEEYYYVLLHDILTFEMLISNDGVKEDVSEFTQRIIDKCELNQEFVDEYCKAIQTFIKCSYEIRDMMEHSKIRFQDMSIVENIFDSIEFEYHIQEEMLRR